MQPVGPSSSRSPVPASLPLQALCVQAQRQPRAPALRLWHEAAWRSISWSELAQRVAQAAQGWRSLGLTSGETLVALGPLGEAFVVTMLAVQSLGARLHAAAEAGVDEALDGAAFVLAHGTRELDLVLARRPAGLRALVVEVEFGAEPDSGGLLLGWHALLARGAPSVHGELALAAGDPVVLQATGPDGRAEALSPASLGAARHGVESGCVLAEFEPHWLPGLRWLNGDWLAQGALLALAPPRDRAGAGLQAVRPSLWLASSATLVAFESQLERRLPTRGLAGLWVRAARGEGRSTVAAWARSRIRRALALGAVRTVLTDGHGPSAALAWLRQLGLRVASASPLPSASAPSAREAHRTRFLVSQAPAANERLEPLMKRVPQ